MAIDRNVPRSGHAGRAGRGARAGRQARFVPIAPQPQPDPTEAPTPIEQAPVEPAPVEPAPVEPAPVEQAPVEQVEPPAPIASPHSYGRPDQVSDGTGSGGAQDGPPRSRLLADLVTHDDLERHEREAAELHAQAADLRARLDAPLPPITPHRRRRTVLGLPLTGALIAAGTVGLILVATQLPWPSGGTAATSAPSARTSPQAAQTGSTGSTGSAGLTPQAAKVPAGLGLPAAGPGIDAEGTALGIRLSTVAGAGSITVAQRVVLGQRGMRAVVVGQPALPSLDGDAATLKPTASGLTAEVNGSAATVKRVGARWTVAAADGSRVRTLLLRYRLRDAIVRSTPSTSGRALGVVSPLRLAGVRVAALQGRTTAPQVIEMVCPGAPEGQMLCGRSGSGGWQATVPLGTRAILMQLDLNKVSS